jgi:diaminopimelate epimerase
MTFAAPVFGRNGLKSKDRPFVKMNGAGNDFMVVQGAGESFDPSPAEVRAWSDRRRGVGFDQLIAISGDPGASALVRFWNADGEPAGACGNGSRCAAWLLMEAGGADEVVFRTQDRSISAKRAGPLRVAVDLGAPKLDWRDIPLAEAMDTRGVELQVGPIDAPLLHTPGCVSMGNPHVVFFVPDAEAAPVDKVGPLIERHPLFPEGVNVGFCEVRSQDRLRLRVWERGVGLTKACGTGACAALVAAARRGLCGRFAEVAADGGLLEVSWRETVDHVILS